MPSVPNAIIYAPGINELAGSGAIDGVARRLARTLDHLDEDVTVAYEVRVVPTEPYAGGTAFAEVRELVRRSPGQEPVVTHRIYNLDYQPALADEQPEGNLFTQTLAVARVCAWMGCVFFGRVLSRQSIGATKKTAVFVGGVSLLLLTGYLFGLVVTMVNTAIHQIGADPAVLAKLRELIPSFLEPAVNVVSGWIQAFWLGGGSIVSAFVLLAGIVGLSFESVRKRLRELVQMFLSFSRYLDGGLGRSVCTGKFNDLLEHVLEQPWSRIDVISYSMGSLIALDSLFPAEDRPNHRTGRVATLATIGCPFDLVRTFWPDYFANRSIPGQSPKWVNVFSPVDLLGSNFANQEGAGVSATHGINATCPKREGSASSAKAKRKHLIPQTNLDYDHAGRKTLDLANAIFGGAYFAHSQYWVRGDYRAESCFNLLVPHLYGASSQE